eukprot:CAMPEP_0118955750 /NCGR_PEP_ID=MMETSP1169-20130426/60450_1 /TAXON_ID=36882 /ORGANISM="Pyramimonas obovata, Strain CCMP722" /LENGTH=126 /DNA_ID=CAMNT_0006903653 /DNA_START=14 /DNA_END=391 /DNA_ORIENTATION=+
MWDSASRAGCMSVVTTSAPSIANAIPATPSPAPSSRHRRDAQGSSSSTDVLVADSASRGPPSCRLPSSPHLCTNLASLRPAFHKNTLSRLLSGRTLCITWMDLFSSFPNPVTSNSASPLYTPKHSG